MKYWKWGALILRVPVQTSLEGLVISYNGTGIGRVGAQTVALVAEDLDPISRHSWNSSPKLLVLRVAKEDHCFDALANACIQLLNGASRYGGSLTVTTGHKICLRTLRSRLFEKTLHGRNCRRRRATGEEVVSQGGRIFYTL